MTDVTQDPKDPNYQDILTKYADSLKSTEAPIPEPQSQTDPQVQLDPTIPEPKPETAPTEAPTALEPDPNAQIIPETEPQTAVMTEANPQAVSEAPIVPQPEVKPEIPAEPLISPQPASEGGPQPEAPPVIIQPEVQIPPSMMAETPVDTFVPPAPHPIQIAPDMAPPKENHFFKYLFFISFIIFVIVLASVGYSFFNTQKTLSDIKNTPTSAPSPTTAPENVCEINGTKYDIGQTFTATDGCNNCSCESDLNIACTAMACETTPSAKLTPTKTATPSATKTPTKAPSPTESMEP